MRKPQFSDAKRGAAITVKVSVRAKKTGVSGVMDDGTIKIRIAAPPVDGAANIALVEYLAEVLRLPQNQVDIVAGETSERKLISLVGISPEKVDSILRGLLDDSDDE